MKAIEADLPIKPTFQMLLCPVIDSTATVSSIWASSQNAPWLTPDRMHWYQDKYFSDRKEAGNWDASPNFAPSNLLGQSPETFIAVAECDLLAPEEIEFAKRLSDAGNKVEIKVYKGATHSVLILAG
jgi:acetyl esterase/lipase